MELKNLFLDRFLRKDTSQSSETQDSAFVAADSTDSEPTSIPSGGAAQDINISNITLNGSQITPGSIPSSTINLANVGWTQTCTFSVTDLNTVSWGSGTFTSAAGVSYAISAGNTGNMAARTYIYLDVSISTSSYQTTTNITTPVGDGKVLIAVAQNAAVTATYALTQTNQISGDSIIANTIVAGKMNVSTLSSITADIGTITAGSITGVVIKTANSGQRIELQSTLMEFFDSSGNEFDIYSDGGSLLLQSMVSSGNIGIIAGATGGISLKCSTTTIATITKGASTGGIVPGSDNYVFLGTSSTRYADVYTYDVNVASGITLGGVYRTTWPSAGTTTLSGLTIDTTKDWQGYSITNIDHISFNGSGSYIEDVSAVYLLSRSSSPGSPTGALWYYNSGGTEQIRTYLAGFLFSFDLSFV